MLKVYSDCHPHGLIVVVWSVSKNADVHGLSARLRCQARQEDWVICEIKYVPALAFICGKPDSYRHTRAHVLQYSLHLHSCIWPYITLKYTRFFTG